MSKSKRIKSHLQTMEWNLESRLNPDHKYNNMKGIKYFKGQIEGAKKLLSKYAK